MPSIKATSVFGRIFIHWAFSFLAIGVYCGSIVINLMFDFAYLS